MKLIEVTEKRLGIKEMALDLIESPKFQNDLIKAAHEDILTDTNNHDNKQTSTQGLQRFLKTYLGSDYEVDSTKIEESYLEYKKLIRSVTVGTSVEKTEALSNICAMAARGAAAIAVMPLTIGAGLYMENLGFNFLAQASVMLAVEGPLLYVALSKDRDLKVAKNKLKESLEPVISQEVKKQAVDAISASIKEAEEKSKTEVGVNNPRKRRNAEIHQV